jgi:hypothetical protein
VGQAILAHVGQEGHREESALVLQATTTHTHTLVSDCGVVLVTSVSLSNQKAFRNYEITQNQAT